MDNLLLQAQEAMQNEKFAEALAYYEQAIVESPRDAISRQSAALASFKLGRIEDAIALSKSALEIDPQLPMAHVILAEAYHSQNAIAMSREEAKIAFDLAPDSADVLASYGTFLLFDKKTAEAIPILEKAIRINPNLYNVYSNLIFAYGRRGNTKVILNYAKKMHTLRPSFLNSLRVAAAFLIDTQLFRILGVVFFLITIWAVLTKMWSLLIFSFLYIGLLLAAGLYMGIASRKHR